MSTFSCKKCGYFTERSNDLKRHLEKKNKCKKIKIIMTKEKIMHVCEYCDKELSRNDAMIRHIKLLHSDADGNPIQIIKIHSYDYQNIHDMSILEQYLVLSQADSFFMMIRWLNLDVDKPQYHNIKLSHVNKNYIDVYDGISWIKENMMSTLDIFVKETRKSICSIFDRFRLFMSSKKIKNTPLHYFIRNENFDKILCRKLKIYIYNNRKMKFKTTFPYHDKNFEFLLSKRYTWKYVEEVMTILDKLDVNFGQNLDDIYNYVANKIKNNAKLEKKLELFMTNTKNYIDSFHDLLDDEKNNILIKIKKKKSKKYNGIAINDFILDDNT